MPGLNRLALSATVHCLTGCAIGEVLGMIISAAANLDNALSIALSVLLAFLFGYGLTKPAAAAIGPLGPPGGALGPGL